MQSLAGHFTSLPYRLLHRNAHNMERKRTCVTKKLQSWQLCSLYLVDDAHRTQGPYHMQGEHSEVRIPGEWGHWDCLKASWQCLIQTAHLRRSSSKVLLFACPCEWKLMLHICQHSKLSVWDLKMCCYYEWLLFISNHKIKSLGCIYTPWCIIEWFFCSFAFLISVRSKSDFLLLFIQIILKIKWIKRQRKKILQQWIQKTLVKLLMS